MPKITFVGAGSTVFAKNLLGDILSLPELADSEISLFDVDDERLRTSEIVAGKIAAAVGATPKITATTDRRRALDDADHVVTMFQIGGYRPSTVVDFEVPKRYGVRQTIGDTVGVGGIMRALRTVPVLLDVCADMEQLCGNATLLQYVNPMSINCWAINRATTIRTIGLCHSVQHTAHQLAGDLDVPPDDLRYLCAGINHMAFYLRFGRQTDDGIEDLYPAIAEFAAGADDAEPWRSDTDRRGCGRTVRRRPLRDVPPTRAISSPSRANTSPNTCRGSSSAIDLTYSNVSASRSTNIRRVARSNSPAGRTCAPAWRTPMRPST